MVCHSHLARLVAAFSLLVIISAGGRAAHASGAPAGIADLLATAARHDDRQAFDALLTTAFVTWPDKRVEILETAEGIRPDWLKGESLVELKASREKKAEAERRSRARGVVYYLDPKLWNGQMEIGAGQASGDSEEQSFSGGMRFRRSFGSAWEHELDMNLDYARREGETTRERFISDYRVKWKPWSHLFVVNFLELEVNKPDGYDYRVIENMSLGYQILDTETHKLSLEAGPGIRYSKLVNDPTRNLTGLTETELLGRLSSAYEVRLSDSMTFKDRVGVFLGSGATTFDNKAELSARLNAHLAARVSFEVKYDSNAPEGTAPTDTVTRATLVYDF